MPRRARRAACSRPNFVLVPVGERLGLRVEDRVGDLDPLALRSRRARARGRCRPPTRSGPAAGRLGVGVERAAELARTGDRNERSAAGRGRDGPRATAASEATLNRLIVAEPICQVRTHVPHAAARVTSRTPQREPTGRRRRCAWCSSVSMIARSACASARGGASGVSASGRPSAADHEGVRLLVERERVGLAGAADDAAGGAGEADEVLALAAGGAAGELRREARGEQELQAEGERVGAAGARRDRGRAARARWRAGGRRRRAGRRRRRCARRPRRRARRRRARRRARAGADAPATVSARRDGQHVAAALVEHEVEAEERLQPPAEARLRLAHALGDRAHPTRDAGYRGGGSGPLRRSGSSAGRCLRSLPIRISHYTF